MNLVQSVLVTAVTVILLAVCVGAADVQPSTRNARDTGNVASARISSILNGRWITNDYLGVIRAEYKSTNNNTTNETATASGSIHLTNLALFRHNQWTTASGNATYDAEAKAILISCDLFYQEPGLNEFVGGFTAIVEVLGNQSASSCFTLTITSFFEVTKHEVEWPPFVIGETWHRFNSGETCLEFANYDAKLKHLKKTLELQNKTKKKRTMSHTPKKRTTAKTTKTRAAQRNIKKIHVVFTQHFDLGYTDYAWCVVAHYFFYILPGAALSAEAAAAASMPYTYTTHTWLLYFFFNCDELLPYVKPPKGLSFACPAQAALDIVETAIKKKQIVWHDFPFDGFNEMLGADLFDYSFDFSVWLAARFFNHTATAGDGPFGPRVVAQVDVPGLYRAQLRGMGERGVKAIYVGQNGWPGYGRALASLPKLFRWQLPTPSSSASSRANRSANADDSILVMVHRQGYGGISIDDAIVDNATGTALLVQASAENEPPYTPQDVSAVVEHVASEFGLAKSSVIVSTFQSFVADVLSGGRVSNGEEEKGRLSHLQLVQQDVGDAWVRAAASDGVKTANFMRLRSKFEDCVRAGRCPHLAPKVMHAVLFLMTGAEHNFGLPMKINSYEKPVISYMEKRDMVSPAEEILDEIFVAKERPRGTTATTMAKGRVEGTFACNVSSSVTLEIGFDTATGAINHLVKTTRATSANKTDAATVSKSVKQLASPANTLADVLYTVHIVFHGLNNGWGDPDPLQLGAENRPYATQISALGDAGQCAFEVTSLVNQTFESMNTPTGKPYIPLGRNESAQMTVTRRLAFSDAGEGEDGVKLDLEVSFENMLDSAISPFYTSWIRNFGYGDAAFVQFNPQCTITISDDDDDDNRSTDLEWQLETLNVSYSPYDFVPDGNCNYHLVDSATAKTTATTTKGRRGKGRRSLKDAVSDSSTPECATIKSLSAPLLLFGWNNGQWVNNNTWNGTNQTNGQCNPNDSEGISWNLWNQWNANWVVGFPWKEHSSDPQPSSSFSFQMLF